MNTNLNKKVQTFFSKCKLESITKSTVKQVFKDINEQNDYGGILHACVHNKFNEEKVLKLMEELMELGIDVNLRGKLTGYTFIHLALYGYTSNNNDYSYSTDFILKLIRLAKKYGFNVNIVDNDKDTIIHTAIASEVYNGKIEPLIDELGIDFKIDSKDNNGNDIYQALLKYKKEAAITENNIWLTKLENEEQIIKNRVGKLDNSKSEIENTEQYAQSKPKKIGQNFEYNADDLESKEYEFDVNLDFYMRRTKKLIIDLTDIYNRLNKSMILNDDIYNIIEELEKYEKILKDKYNVTISIDICDKIMLKIKSIINNDNVPLPKKVSNKKTDEIPLVKEELDETIKTKENSLEIIDGLKEIITNSHNLNELLKIKKEISSSDDKKVINELTKFINENEEKYLIEINSINELDNLINITNNWLSKKEENAENNLNDLSIKELKELKEEKCSYLKELKEQVLNSVTSQINNIINSTDTLIKNNVFDKKDINEYISKIIDKKPKTKTNRRGRK